ncbi:MAG: hypothetical protein HP494_14365, partial [Nitrospira sp.]|nr:hypothetical protein [Nitrospira sp.]
MSVAPWVEPTKYSGKTGAHTAYPAVVEPWRVLCYDSPGMQTPSKPASASAFQDWLDRVARPIEFATRDECAHLGAVKNLGSFVAEQVLSALANRVYPKTVEARLVSLRDLFADFQRVLPPHEQRRRLQAAVAIVNALRSVARALPESP